MNMIYKRGPKKV